MARYAQRHRRGGSVNPPTGTPTPPDVPDAPTIASINDEGAGEWSVTWHTPAAKPAGCGEWDLLSEEGLNPPTTPQTVDAGEDVDSTTGNVSAPTVIYAMMRAWDPTHAVYTDSAVTTATIDPPAAPAIPLYQSQEETEPGLWAITWRTPAALPAGATTWDILAEQGANPPSGTLQLNAGISSDYVQPGVGDGEPTYAMMRAWNAAHTISTNGPVLEHVAG